MKSTIFITGTSSGIGKATALLFAQNGWNVVATMRKPQDQELAKEKNILLLELDVTKKETISSAIAQTMEKFGRIDVLVNNAGFGTVGVFEHISDSDVRKQFETNVFGLFSVTREVLPILRKQKTGVIINVASVGGRVAFPLYSIYHASKWAIEGFSESLLYELNPLGIQVKVIEPGVINTDFYTRSAVIPQTNELGEYNSFFQKVLPRLQNQRQSGSSAEKVAQTIFQAANDNSKRLRYHVGSDAQLLLFLKRILPFSWFHSFVARITTT